MQALRGEPLTIYGTAARPQLLLVDDLIEGILLLSLEEHLPVTSATR